MTEDEIEKINKLAHSIIVWGRADKHSIYAVKLVQTLAQGAVDLISELELLKIKKGEQHAIRKER